MIFTKIIFYAELRILKLLKCQFFVVFFIENCGVRLQVYQICDLWTNCLENKILVWIYWSAMLNYYLLGCYFVLRFYILKGLWFSCISAQLLGKSLRKVNRPQLVQQVLFFCSQHQDQKDPSHSSGRELSDHAPRLSE